jgi:hypothetical protein
VTRGLSTLLDMHAGHAAAPGCEYASVSGLQTSPSPRSPTRKTARGSALKPIPIFDTNIFGHAQDGSITQNEWQRLLCHRPRRGWPLSAVTALELLAGPHDAQGFPEFKRRIELAYQVSTGRVLREPRICFCRQVLKKPFPSELGELSPGSLNFHLAIVQRAKSLADIVEHRVAYKSRLSGKRRAGFQPSLIKDLVAGPKRDWIRVTQNLADRLYPDWRTHFEQTGKRLPTEMRRQLESRGVWEAQRPGLAESTLKWLKAESSSELVRETVEWLNAAHEFTLSVVREFLFTNYSLEEHESDVYDQFQLHYLAIDRYVIVSNDRNLRRRASGSSQADRIVSFERFLQSL